ncbi:hypothetical protein D3C71_1126840 [compost metagenome]
MCVLCDGFRGKTTNGINRLSPQNRARAAEERGIPQVITVLDQPVEELTFVRIPTEHSQVAFEGIRREEMVRRLHQRKARVAAEPPGGDLQKRAHGEVVAVEDRHQLAIDLGQGMIEIASLGMLVIAAGNVIDADALGKFAEFSALAVVQHMDAQLVGGPVKAHRGVYGMSYQRQVFVVGGDQHINRRPLRRIRRQGGRLAVQRPCHLHVPQHQHQPGIGFSSQKDDTADQVKGAVPVQRRCIAPPQVTTRHGDRQHDQDQRCITARHAPHQQGDTP